MSGIHGLATTFGRIPFDNHTESTMIKAGPMAASAADAALTYAALSGCVAWLCLLWCGWRCAIRTDCLVFVCAPLCPYSDAAPCRPDEHDFYTQLYDGGVHGPPQAHLTSFLDGDLAGVRLGVFAEWFNDSQPEIRARCYEVVDFLESRGEWLSAICSVLCSSLTSSALAQAPPSCL